LNFSSSRFWSRETKKQSFVRGSFSLDHKLALFQRRVTGAAKKMRRSRESKYANTNNWSAALILGRDELYITGGNFVSDSTRGWKAAALGILNIFFPFARSLWRWGALFVRSSRMCMYLQINRHSARSSTPRDVFWEKVVKWIDTVCGPFRSVVYCIFWSTN